MATKYLDTLQNIDAEHRDNFLLKGLIKGSNNQPDSALYYFNSLLTKYPKDTIVYVYRAQTHMRLRKWALAEKDWTIAIEKGFHDLGHCYFDRGVCLDQLGKKDEAKADFESAIKYNPKDAMAYGKLGEMYAYKNNYEKACKLWQQSVDLGFKDPANYIKKYCK